jgi:hypothetical protein
VARTPEIGILAAYALPPPTLLRAEIAMDQQWLQVIGLFFDGLGFALIALEWYRGYREMRAKVTLVARNMERAEKARLQREIKDAIGSVGVAEVGALYKDDHALADLAQHAYEIDQIDRFRKTQARLFFAGVAAFIAGMVLQLLGAWPGCCAFIGIIPQSLG